MGQRLGDVRRRPAQRLLRPVTEEAGRTLVSGDGLLVAYPPTGARGMHLVEESTLVRIGDLPPLPGCR